MVRTTHRALLAAFVALCLATPAFSHNGIDHSAAGEMAPITIGDIAITGPFTRATLPNAPVGGGFLTLTNNGASDDRLVSVSSPIARDAQIHEMAMEGDVMKMRQLVDGLVIPAGQSVVLEPGGYHIMFMGLTQALVEGETVPVTLTFEKAGTITIDLSVGTAAADAPSGHMGH